MAEVQLSKLMVARGDTDAALTHATAAAKANPSNLDARLSVASALLARGSVARADAELSSLRAQYPNAPAVHALSGVLHAVRSRTEEAAKEFERALALDPGNVQALNGLATLDVRASRPERARARIADALSRNPGQSDLLLLAARVENTLKNYGAAEAHLRKVLEIAPDSLDAYDMLGRIYLRQDRLEDARLEFERLAAAKPDSVAARTMIGMIYSAQGKEAEARAAYEEIFARGLDAPVAANNLAWMYVERGEKLDQALQLAQRAKQRLPERADVSDTLGWIYYKRGLAQNAIPLLRQSVESSPRNPFYQYHLGMACAAAGRNEEARAALQEALKLQPNFKGAEEAKATLAGLKN